MSNATIIAAIDAAIEAWVGQPMSVSVNGKTIIYRSMDDLLAARKVFASQLRTAGGAVGFQIHHIKAGGPV